VFQAETTTECVTDIDLLNKDDNFHVDSTTFKEASKIIMLEAS